MASESGAPLRVTTPTASYDIAVPAADCLDTFAQDLAFAPKSGLPKWGSLVVISDEHVWFWHGAKLRRAISNALAGQRDKEGTKVLVVLLPPGEAAKTRETKEKIEDAMLAHNCHRDTLLVAFGGGVVGDLGGFVASTYMRGIAFVQLPTTLLAMVDSSIGGKTGLDVPAGKNLIGSFWQPSRVYLGPERFLSSLPARELSNGYAEVVKVAAIRDAALFDLLEDRVEELLGADGKEGDEEAASVAVSVMPVRAHNAAAVPSAAGSDSSIDALFDIVLLDEKSATVPALQRAPASKGFELLPSPSSAPAFGADVFLAVDPDSPIRARLGPALVKSNRRQFTDPSLLRRVIGWAAGIKARVVSGDEREGGERALLNFGHTVGHGIEAYLQPAWLHGECVSVGMVKECEAARALGVVSSAVTARLKRVLASYNLPVKVPHALVASKGEAIDKIFKYMAVDKKNVKGAARKQEDGTVDAAAGAGAGSATGAASTSPFPLAVGSDASLESDPVFLAADRAHRSGISIKCVLLNGIGSTLDTPGFTHAVPPHLLARLLSSAVSVQPEITPDLPLHSSAVSSSSAATQSPLLSITRVRTPGSKSLSNRALLLAGLCRGSTRITGLLDSDDTQVMMACLRALGATVTVSPSGEEALVVGTGGSGLRVPPASLQPLYVGNAGTASRFLTALLCLLPFDSSSSVEIRGNSRMHERPIAPLVDALRSQGAQISYLPPSPTAGGENKGCLPLKFTAGIRSSASASDTAVTADRVLIASSGPGSPPKQALVRRVQLAAKLSSQYVSAILMTAPLYPPVVASTPDIEDAGFVDVVLDEESPTSLPYILMTCATMKEFGVEVLRLKDNHYRVPRVHYLPPKSFSRPASVAVVDVESGDGAAVAYQRRSADPYSISKTHPGHFAIEADASSASYPAAVAAITGRAVLLEGVGSSSSQGDANFPILLKGMGCFVHQSRENTLVCGPGALPLQHSAEALADSIYSQCFAAEGDIKDRADLLTALQAYAASASSAASSGAHTLKSVGRINMENETDCFMTMAVLAAVASSTTVITGINNQRVKECDRIAATRTELCKLGVDAREEGDDLIINGLGLAIGCTNGKGRRLPLAVPSPAASTAPVLVHCYDDHRIAMSFACLSLALKTQTAGTATAMVLDDSLCVEKTYPTFWEHLEALFGVAVQGRALDRYSEATAPSS